MPSNDKKENKDWATNNPVSKMLGGVTKKAGTFSKRKLSANASRNPKTQVTVGDQKGNHSFDRTMTQFNDEMFEKWDDICDYLEAFDNETIQWITKSFLRKLSVEAPVVVGLVFVCVFIHLLNVTILPGISRKWLGVPQSFRYSTNPLVYFKLVTHIFAHENMWHLRGNMTNILLVGPSAENVFGSKNIVVIMIAVAISSGFGHMLLGPRDSTQIGASGVVFALILLNSLVTAKAGKIPLSFVLTVVLWAGDELWKLFFANDTISHSAHLIGAIVGTAAGYAIQLQQESSEVLHNARAWNIFPAKQSNKDKSQ